jgi:uncharacterized protein YjbI with pentapeptide repeats
LTWTDAGGAYFSRANLAGADFTQADIQSARFSEAKGIDRIIGLDAVLNRRSAIFD